MLNEIATFINRLANLINNDTKNPPSWIVLEIWALESIKSVDVLLLNIFLSFVNNNSWGRSFPSGIFTLILRVVPFLFLASVFSCLNCVSDNLAVENLTI